MTDRRQLLRTLPVLAAALALSGCGKGGIAVKGTVKLAGAPLPAAIITLEPDPSSGTTGAGAIVRIRDGQFEIGSAKNLTPGTYVVRVSPVPLNVGDDLATAPPRFRIWETRAEIGPGQSPLDLDVPNIRP